MPVARSLSLVLAHTEEEARHLQVADTWAERGQKRQSKSSAAQPTTPTLPVSPASPVDRWTGTVDTVAPAGSGKEQGTDTVDKVLAVVRHQ